jgi:hypothetical protein
VRCYEEVKAVDGVVNGVADVDLLEDVDDELYTVPKTRQISKSIGEGVPWRGNFPINSRKLGIISSDYWEIYPPEDFLCYTLGNLLCFRTV